MKVQKEKILSILSKNYFRPRLVYIDVEGILETNVKKYYSS